MENPTMANEYRYPVHLYWSYCWHALNTLIQTLKIGFPKRFETICSKKKCQIDGKKPVMIRRTKREKHQEKPTCSRGLSDKNEEEIEMDEEGIIMHYVWNILFDPVNNPNFQCTLVLQILCCVDVISIFLASQFVLGRWYVHRVLIVWR